MKNERKTRREFLEEAGAFLWVIASGVSLTEGVIRVGGYEQEVNSLYPDLDARAKRELITEISSKESWKTIVEGSVIFGGLTAIFLWPLKRGPMMNH